jgi:hypothetical protein
MTKEDLFNPVRPTLAGFAALCLGATLVLAAPDDEIVVIEPVAAAAQQHFFVDENFDQWIFPGAQNAAAGKARLQTQVRLKLSEIERVCQLKPEQKQRLELAAKGDLQRFFDQMELVRKKFDKVKHDQNAWGEIWPEVQPLQVKQARLTEADSLLVKMLPKTLSPEQAAKYEEVARERRLFRFRACVANSLVTLDNAVALKHDQREALSKLLLEETQPPQTFGQYNHYLVMYRLATLPQQKIKPLLDDRQWQAMQQQFNQYRGMRQFLVEQGLISRDELGQAELAVPDANAVEVDIQ